MVIPIPHEWDEGFVWGFLAGALFSLCFVIVVVVKRLHDVREEKFDSWVRRVVAYRRRRHRK